MGACTALHEPARARVVGRGSDGARVLRFVEQGRTRASRHGAMRIHGALVRRYARWSCPAESGSTPAEWGPEAVRLHLQKHLLAERVATSDQPCSPVDLTSDPHLPPAHNYA